MKKRILCFALAAMMIGGNVATTIPVYAAENGTSIILTKSEDDPYTGREYIAPIDKTTVSDITLPDGWSWLDTDQTLTTEFADAVAVQIVDGNTETNRVTVKVKKEADTEAPTGAITIETNNWNTFLNTVTFNKLFKMTKTVTIAAQDNLAVASVQYYASAKALTLEQVKALGADDWKAYPENGFTLEPTSSYVVYALITDTSGNKTYISSDGLVFLTEKAPDIFVTAISKDSFTVKANVDEKSLDGIKEVGIKYRKSGDSTWTVVKADNVSASNELTAASLSAGEDYEVRAFVTYIDDTSSETAEANATIITTESQDIPVGSITVNIESKLAESKDAVITIEKGNSVIATAEAKGITSSKTSVSGAFKNLPDGVYNAVVRTTDGKFVETKMIIIKDGSASNVTFTIREGELKSTVKIVDNVIPVAVEGLSDILNDTSIVSTDDISKVQADELSVTVKLQVKSADSTSTGASQIESLATEKYYNVAKLLDISLYKVTKNLTDANASETEVNIGSSNTNVLEIAVPYDTTIENLSVFRYHGDTAKELTKLSTQPSADYTDGTFYVGDGYIYIYASGFSVYGITEPKSKAEGPEAPSGLVPTAPTTSGGSDGQISGVTTAMEYSTDNGSTWTQVTANPITGLKAGKVLVRVAGTTTTNPGKNATVIVPEYTAPSTDKNAGPAAPDSSKFTLTAPTSKDGIDGKISGVDETMEYSTDGGTTWKSVTGTEITGLAGGVSVSVRVKETDDTYAGASVVVTVPEYKNSDSGSGNTGNDDTQNDNTGKSDGGSQNTSKKAGPVAPSSSKVTYTAPTSTSGTDAKITGVDSTMEYSTDGGKTWTSVTGTKITGLSAGEVWIRVKETSDTAAGEVLKITIPAYQSTTDTVVTAPKTGDNSHLVLWESLFVCSVAALGIVVVTSRRKRHDAG